MAKDLDSLLKSREERGDFIKKYGLVPTSILEKTTEDNERIGLSYDNKRSYKQTAQNQKNKIKSRVKQSSLLPIFKYSGYGVTKNKAAALSIFPQAIGRLCTNFYCSSRGLVFDPFAGHNSRMQLVFETNRSYIGVDVSKTFHADNMKIKKMLLEKNKSQLFRDSGSITLFNKSSDNLPEIKSNLADFTITSPPYWDIEYYGDEEEQLGKSKTYASFLDSMYRHIKENYRILKPGTFCCWFINDFVKKNKYFAYHSDLIPLFIKVGFVLHTIYIVNLKRSMQTMFLQSVIKSKRFPKIHEYCLVFKKPS